MILANTRQFNTVHTKCFFRHIINRYFNFVLLSHFKPFHCCHIFSSCNKLYIKENYNGKKTCFFRFCLLAHSSLYFISRFSFYEIFICSHEPMQSLFYALNYLCCVTNLLFVYVVIIFMGKWKRSFFGGKYTTK